MVIIMPKPIKLSGLEYSLTVGCRYDCKTCPQDKFVGKYFCTDKKRKSVLSFEDFLVSLNDINPGGFISFAGMSEPFLNPNCGKMIRVAYDKGYKVVIYSTFELMDEKSWELINNIEFASVVIHVADSENNAKFILSDDYPEILRKVLDRFPNALISYHGNCHPVIKEVVGHRSNGNETFIDRAGNLSEAKLHSIENLV